MAAKKAFFWGLVAGMGAGAVLTFLFSPTNGKHTRDIVSYRFSNVWAKIRGLWENKELFSNEARKQGEDHVDFINREAQRLQMKMEGIHQQIRSKKTKDK
ncbi:MAG: YtxH domain-containing protein [Microscillaceae bacterium]|nr:YtxH domain-containing protein [Microscillaceae bacterium]